MSRLIDTWRMDRTAWSIETLANQGRDREYWMTRDPAERLAAIESGAANTLWIRPIYRPTSKSLFNT